MEAYHAANALLDALELYRVNLSRDFLPNVIAALDRLPKLCQQYPAIQAVVSVLREPSTDEELYYTTRPTLYYLTGETLGATISWGLYASVGPDAADIVGEELFNLAIDFANSAEDNGNPNGEYVRAIARGLNAITYPYPNPSPMWPFTEFLSETLDYIPTTVAAPTTFVYHA